ncbi:hypothetical protein VZT92_016306 [Zoarces viviparus]|uniref:CBM21 domain-containing protein n=1 Tax=Zoarces viviparus TaxID=48416 RepID=A0AAW1ETM3_ZOAVI
MEGLHVPTLEEEGEIMEEERENNGEREEGGMKASSPMGSTTDDETDEDSEAEPPQVSRRKVSFADAFGLNLVSVKEFDNPEVAELDISQPPKNEATHPFEEFSMSCLFTVPSSPEELDQRLQDQMVELENIELLPGTTTLRGMVRVVNLCYSKSVNARMTLDGWTNYFDLSAEYVPGSSDRKTDRFTFKYTLVPPFERGGTRVEICLRYDTSVGTFWANNKEMNYVLFCHRKGHVKEHGPQVQEERIGYKSKRSCLKAFRRAAAEEKIRETSNPSTAAADAEATPKAEEANRKNGTDVQSLLYQEERKPWVESIKSRQRVARMARVQDYLSQRRQQVSKAYSHDSANGQRVSQPLPTLWGDSAGFLHKRQQKQSNESPQVLTYHQIPLLTLDWNNDKDHRWRAADMDDIWTGRAEVTLSKASEENKEDTPSVSDMWGNFGNGTDDTADKNTSVCDAWQAFLNGPSCADHSAVPESEWLQTAALVSPSNDKEPDAQYVASSQEHEFQDDMKGQEEDEGCELSPEEAKKNVAKRDTSTELQHQPETLERTEGDVSQRDKDERASIGKLKIEVLGESMGNAENARGETENAPAELKEQELSAEVESSPGVEYKKLSEGTKDPITAENAVALEVMESGLEKMFIERFADDLVRGIWEEVFGRKEQTFNRDADIVDGMEGKLADVPDIRQDGYDPFEKDFNDAFDSGVLSLTDLSTDPNSSLCQGLEQTVATKSNEYSPKERIAGFVFIVFLYDFPAFFALYIFSLCWWFSKLKRHRGMKDKVMEG